MEIDHITEWQVQEFIFETAPIPDSISAHLDECAVCWDKINEYRVVAKVLSRSEKIVLDEYLKHSIMAEIKTIKKSSKLSFGALLSRIIGQRNKGSDK